MWVSIQLLLLFYFSFDCAGIAFLSVSIQLLLLFYFFASDPNHSPFRFNTTLVTVLFTTICIRQHITILFQYNSCYCSIFEIIHDHGEDEEFQYNSCYCSIQDLDGHTGILQLFQYNSCYCSMRLLKDRWVLMYWFQYNSCYCSIYPDHT